MGPFRLRLEPDRRFATFTAGSHLAHPKTTKKTTTRGGILMTPVADSLGLSPAGHSLALELRTACSCLLIVEPAIIRLRVSNP